MVKETYVAGQQGDDSDISDENEQYACRTGGDQSHELPAPTDKARSSRQFPTPLTCVEPIFPWNGLDEATSRPEL